MAKGLTQPSLEKIRATEKRQELPDGGCAGLYYIIQPSNARSWAIRYRIDGRPRKYTLGSATELGLTDARVAATAALNLAEKGIDPASAKQAAKAEREDDKYVFETVLRSFFVRYAVGKNRAWRETARLLGLVPAMGGDRDDVTTFELAPGSIGMRWKAKDLRTITPADGIAEIDRIVDRGARIVANRTLAALRKLFSWAMNDRHLIRANPFAGMAPPSSETSRDRVLSDDEIRWFWKATANVGSPFGPLGRLLLLLAQRRDEVAGMTYAELDGADWVIPKERAKNNRAHHVPMSEAALATLHGTPRIAGKAGYIFTTTGETPVSGWSRAKQILDRQMLAIAQNEALERGQNEEVSIPHWTLHDLRRTAASGMAKLGIAVHVVERLLNHRSGSIRGVAAIYNRHDYKAERRAAVEAWAAYVLGLVSSAGNQASPLRGAE